MKPATPYWPRAMLRGSAARYCELSVADFEREVNDGRLPMPFLLGRHEHWDRFKLDQALEAIAGGADNDWRRRCGLYDAA